MQLGRRCRVEFMHVPDESQCKLLPRSRLLATDCPRPFMRAPFSASAIICLVTVLFLAPFVNKAFHVDDPLFIWSAQQIQTHPLDPYGSTINWNDTPEPMWQVTKNPPLDCYYIAAIGALTGYGEIPLHIAFWIPACLVTLGTYVLAKRFVRRPLWAAFLALVCPAFWVSATSVMCDVWMTACCVWAAIYWLRAVDGNRAMDYLTCGILLALGALFKFFAVGLLSVFLVHGALRRANPGWALLTFILPVGALFGYEAWTHATYGYGLVSEAMRWSARARGTFFHGRTRQSLVAFIYFGGCVLPVGLVGAVLARRANGFFAAAAVGLLGMAWGLSTLEPKDYDYVADFAPVGVWTHALLFFFLAVAALWCVAKAVASGGRESGVADGYLLGLWVLMTLVFVGGFNWVVNARVILPLVPPLAILGQMAIERVAPNWGRRQFALAMAPAVLLGFLVNLGDAQLAEAGRRAPDLLRQATGVAPDRFSFTTHWGFQYYMQFAGARAVDKKFPAVRTGDWIVQPTQGSSGMLLSAGPQLRLVTTVRPTAWPVASTCGPREYFYATFGRVLPFRFGVGHAQEFEVFQVQ